MRGPDIQFQRGDNEDTRLEKLRRLAQFVQDLARSQARQTTAESTGISITMTGPGVLGRITGTGAPDTLNGAQLVTLLPLFTPAERGLVPSPGAVTNNRFLRDDGAWTTLSLSLGALADPGATIGLTVVNGSAGTAMRSDAAPALSQAIAPIWTADHRWTEDTEVQWGNAGEMTAFFDGTDGFVGTTTGHLNLVAAGEVRANGDQVVVETRAVNTGTGLTGGGNLSADRTIALDAATIALLALVEDLEELTFLTEDDETAVAPNSRQLLPGSNITFDDTTPGELTINAAGGDIPIYYTKEWRARDAGMDVFGTTALTTGGTLDTPAKAAGGANVRQYISKRRSTSLTTANAVAFFRSSSVQDEAYVNATAAGAAGFELRARFGTQAVVAGERFFCGMVTAGAIPGTTDPSALTNIIGIGKDGADTNYQFMHNDGAGTATKVDLGLAFAASKTFDLYLSVPRGGGSVTYRLVDLDTTTEYTGTVSTNIPATDAPVNWQLHGSVGGTGGVAIAVEFSEVGLRHAL